MRWTFKILVTLFSGLSACSPPQPEPVPMQNPISYVEIPVTNMPRAMAFYTRVFSFTLERQTIDGYDMALFPASETGAGATGALAKGDVYKPSRDGAVIYFRVADIDETLKRAAQAQARILYPKKDIGEFGFVAEIEDSEGNRIALSALK